MVDQMNRWIHSGQEFAGSFNLIYHFPSVLGSLILVQIILNLCVNLGQRRELRQRGTTIPSLDAKLFIRRTRFEFRFSAQISRISSVKELPSLVLFIRYRIMFPCMFRFLNIKAKISHCQSLDGLQEALVLKTITYCRPYFIDRSWRCTRSNENSSCGTSV